MRPASSSSSASRFMSASYIATAALMKLSLLALNSCGVFVSHAVRTSLSCRCEPA